MIKKSTKNLNASVQKYNASLFASISDMPNTVSFVDLKDPEGTVYETLDLDVMVRSFYCILLTSIPLTRLYDLIVVLLIFTEGAGFSISQSC